MSAAQHDPFDPEASREDARRNDLVYATRQADDVKQLMGQAWGRRLMWSWLEFAGVHRLSFTAGDPTQTAFNEGARNVGLMLMASVLEHAPEEYALMRLEAKADLEMRNEVQSQQRSDSRSWLQRGVDRLRRV